MQWATFVLDSSEIRGKWRVDLFKVLGKMMRRNKIWYRIYCVKNVVMGGLQGMKTSRVVTLLDICTMRGCERIEVLSRRGV